MLEPETAAFLETGCALIVGTVATDGEPLAARGWGLTVLDPSRVTVRLLLDVADITTIEHLAAGGAVAVTSADVRTLRSVQMKGRARGVEIATGEDAARRRALLRRLHHRRRRDRRHRPAPARAVGARLLHRLHDRRGGALRPDAGADRRRTDRPAVVTLTLDDLRLCCEGAVPAVIATAAADGTPNITYLSRIHLVDAERIALSNQFFSKTQRNLAENPRASLLLVDPTTYDAVPAVGRLRAHRPAGTGLRAAP